jgi:2-hydroxy-6-oxonona-2,4-dienedioate hydrolase
MSFWTQLLDVPHELGFVEAGGVRTRVLRGGEGETVIMLHGISGHLEAFIPTFGLHAEHFDVHAIDMLGHGYTGRPEGNYTVARLADHVIAYLDAIGVERAHVVGISQGGWTAGYLAAEHPDRVKRITMIAAPGNPGMGTEVVRDLVVGSTTQAVLSEDREDTLQRLTGLVYDASTVGDEMIDVRFGIYHTSEFRRALPQILSTAEPEFYQRDMLSIERLQSIKAEVLLVWSEQDAYQDLMGGVYFDENLPHSKLVVLDRTGHWPPYERPADFARINTAFLSEGLDAVEAGIQ